MTKLTSSFTDSTVEISYIKEADYYEFIVNTNAYNSYTVVAFNIKPHELVKFKAQLNGLLENK